MSGLRQVSPAAFALLLFGTASSALAAPAAPLPPPAGAAVDFEKDIRPLLEQSCVKCHGADKQKGDLRLDLKAAAFKGGADGPVIVPGKSAESALIIAVSGIDPDRVMPEKGERFTAAQVGLLRRWIDDGAKWPDEAVAAQQTRPTPWSFLAVKRPEPPKGVAAQPIDAFVKTGLAAKQLTLSPEADRSTLIRRLYLVMHGLPPSWEEVDQFVKDQSPNAYEKLVDRVLASPRYGERWARHWLDVARYADSNGFETNRERKTAYPYRDFVIQSFNADKPYDEFIKEQLAGDALGTDAGTGFLVAGAFDIVKSPDINLTLMQREDELADMVNTTGTAFLGLTMGCARCHDHKFDPILQKDYYAMKAVFAGVNFGERKLTKKVDGAGEKEVAALRQQIATDEASLAAFQAKANNAPRVANAPAPTLRPPVNAKLNTEDFPVVEATAVRFTILATTGAEPCIDELEVLDGTGRNIARAATGIKVSASGTYANNPSHKLEHLNDGLTGNSRSWISNTSGKGWVQIDFPTKQRFQRILWGRDRDQAFNDRVATQYRIEVATTPGQWKQVASSDDRQPFNGKSNPNAFLALLSKEDATAARDVQRRLGDAKGRLAMLTEGVSAWIGTFSQPGVTNRLYRGDPMQKREVVAPDTLTILGSLKMDVNEPEQKRRVKLAQWIASPENPLTSRVMVNRLWHYIFGNGIVETPSDFGANGFLPNNPALLDWLADEFVRGKWSIKHMQKLILLSETFRQAGRPRSEGMAVDAGDRLLWRFPPRRLEAESIRDSMLAASGAINLAMGGPGFYLQDVQNENVMHYFPKEKFGAEEFRRMVYLFRIRAEQDSVFGSFDCPSGNQVMPKRSRSNTPLQALNLFNSAFVLQQADLLAARLKKEAGEQPEAQAARAFQLLVARPPDVFERDASAEMIRAQGLPAFCRALYNTSEFLFVF